MTVQPRHIAWILKRLTPAEQDVLPWHRVVSEKGRLPANRVNHWGQTQSELIAQDGLSIVDGRVSEFSSVFIDVSGVNSGVTGGKRYSDAG